MEVVSVDPLATGLLGSPRMQGVVDDAARQPTFDNLGNSGTVVGLIQFDDLKPSHHASFDESKRFLGRDPAGQGQSCQGRIAFGKAVGGADSDVAVRRVSTKRLKAHRVVR